MTPTILRRSLFAAAATAALAAPVQAHHGFGLFQVDTIVHYEGTITGMDFVNPHSYLYFDRVDEVHQVESVERPDPQNMVVYDQLASVFRQAGVDQARLGDLLAAVETPASG